jgi:hypothetical protein
MEEVQQRCESQLTLAARGKGPSSVSAMAEVVQRVLLEANKHWQNAIDRVRKAGEATAACRARVQDASLTLEDRVTQVEGN